jgi:hypothetical protein
LRFDEYCDRFCRFIFDRCAVQIVLGSHGQRLLIKYNIGTFIDDRDRIRKTAARVGLGIPGSCFVSLRVDDRVFSS